MKRFRSRIESDEEGCVADSQTGENNRNLKQTREMSPAKSRRRIRAPPLREHQFSATDSTSGFSSFSATTDDAFESTSDIFYIYNAGNIKPVVDTLQRRSSEKALGRRERFKKLTGANKAIELSEAKKRKPKLSSSTSVSSTYAGNIPKHSNLDTLQPIKLRDQFRLALIRYLTISNGIRMALVAFCIGYFLYNAITIYKEYATFDTIVYLEYRAPKTTFPPAISVCTNCIMCSLQKSTQKINVIDFYGPMLDNMTNNLNRHDQGFELSKTEDYSWEGFSMNCTFVNSTINSKESRSIDCSKLVPPIYTVQEGRFCKTFFSDIEGQLSRKNNKAFLLKHDYFPQIIIEVNGPMLQKSISPDNNSDDVDDDDKRNKTLKTTSKDIDKGLYITVSDPTQLPLMEDVSFHKIQDKKLIDIHFQKKIELLKKPPYETKCYNYSDNINLTKPNLFEFAFKKDDEFQYKDLKIFRSRGECILYCLWGHSKDHSCVNIYSMFNYAMVNLTDMNFFHHPEIRHRFAKTMFDDNSHVNFCPYDNNTLNNYQKYKQNCLEKCNKACFVESYSIDPNILDYGSDMISGTTILISWSPESFTYIEHKERMDLSWFLGNIGGQLHIWLSLSVINLIRYLINLMKTGEFVHSTSCCCMIHWWKLVLSRRKEQISLS